MTQANVTMTMRKSSANASIVDIRGEVTAFAENILMDAYTGATTGGARAIILNFSDLGYMNSWWHRSHRHAPDSSQPPGPAAARSWPERALSAHLRADQAK